MLKSLHGGVSLHRLAPKGPHPTEHCTCSVSWRTFSSPVRSKVGILLFQPSLCSSDDGNSKNLPADHVVQPLKSDEMKSLLADSERAKLTRKLSEANQQNRFLKRQLHVKEEALVNSKNELANMEQDIQALSKLAGEIANSDIPEGTRKINGKYLQSHLLSRLEDLRNKMKDLVKDVDSAQSKKVQLLWCGMAESVQVMGSFDGWNYGEHLSPEYSGCYTKFSTTILLRPGWYEIKFLVDEEWQLSPDLPTVGEGATMNNLLVVE